MIIFSFCFPPETKDTAVREDIVILEKQQKGLGIPYQRTGRYCAQLEPMVANFAYWYAKKLLNWREKT